MVCFRGRVVWGVFKFGDNSRVVYRGIGCSGVYVVRGCRV